MALRSNASNEFCVLEVDLDAPIPLYPLLGLGKLLDNLKNHLDFLVIGDLAALPGLKK